MLDSQDLSQFTPQQAECIRLVNTYYIDTCETFGEHSQTCDGCPHCVQLRKLVYQIETNMKGIADVPNFQIILCRAMNQRMHTISLYYPDKAAIFDRVHNTLNKNVYMVCQFMGFNNQKIEEYFGIKTKMMNAFMHDNFPTWKEDKKYFRETLGPIFFAEWKKDHPVLTRMYHLDRNNTAEITTNDIVTMAA